MQVVFSERAYSSILSETASKIDTETGGLFLGHVQDNVWYVIEAIDPGVKSVFEIAYFEYDQAYTSHLANVVSRIYREPLKLIGLWHRHPGSFDCFSVTDNGTNLKYANLHPNEGAISALVNIDPEFRITLYHVDRNCRYEKINYVVDNSLIPEKYLKQVSAFNECFTFNIEKDNLDSVDVSVIKEVIDRMPLIMFDTAMEVDNEYLETLLCNIEQDILFLRKKFGNTILMRKDNLLCIKIGANLEILFSCMVTHDGYACSYGAAWHEYHFGDIQQGIMQLYPQEDIDQGKEGFLSKVKRKILCLMEKVRKNSRS